MRYKPLSYIVNSVKVDRGEEESNNDQRYLQMAINGFRELNLTTLPSYKVVAIDISDSFTVELPHDYVDYLFIGVQTSCGKIVTLTRDDSIAVSRDECETETPFETVVEDCECGIVDVVSRYGTGYFIPTFYRGGQWVGEQYALTGGYNKRGYYTIDHQQNRIQLKNTLPKTQIILHYKTTGIEGCDTCVPEDVTQALIEYVHWKIARNDPQQGRLVAAERQAEFFRQRKILLSRKLKFTKEEYLDHFYRHIKLTPKR